MFGITEAIDTLVKTTWPMILVSVVIIVTLRLTYLIKNREHLILYKELFVLSFIIYVLALFQVVTSQDVVSWSTNNFVPFKEIFRYNIGSRLFIKNVIGNIILFLPYGFFASFYLKPKKVWLVVALTFVASLTIETVQMSIGRVFDVDDILLNTLGGMIGTYIYLVFQKFSSKIPTFFRNEIFLDVISVIVLLILLTLI